MATHRSRPMADEDDGGRERFRVSMSNDIAQPAVADAAPRASGWRGALARMRVSCVIAWIVLIGGLILPTAGAGIAICPSKAVSGVPCPGCGMTRSVTNWMHGDVSEAMRYHPFGWAAVVVAAWFAIKPVLPRAVRRMDQLRVVRVAAIVFLLIFVGYGVVRAARWIGGDHTIAAGG